MKNKVTVLALSAGLLLGSCEAIQNTNHTQRGAAVGATSGAVIGGVLGNNVGKGDNAVLGAIAGAVIGGVAGGLIGNRMDKQAEKIENTLPGAEVVRTAEGIQVILDEQSDVRFEYDKSDLTAQAKANLDKLIPVFNEYPDTDILVVGFTDSKGSDAYNQGLSERRASSVVAYLKAKGINSSRLKSIGQGETNPRGDNNTEAGRAQNRRVEFGITANDKMIEDAKNEAGQ
ncbi:OmpA family protein [Moheibacter stercoris]|uniref:Outer membrane protein OmpA-like peptidoglycan-associated protein n=1 Tax=Moheibacter stercoris TaxID=1628251 RepID=A0ABV2LT57_9FLAO